MVGRTTGLTEPYVVSIIYIYIWAILLRVTEYYSVTLFELTVSGICTDFFEAVELMLSVVFNRSSSLVQKLFVIFFGTGRVIYRSKTLDNYISSILNVFCKIIMI